MSVKIENGKVIFNGKIVGTLIRTPRGMIYKTTRRAIAEKHTNHPLAGSHIMKIMGPGIFISTEVLEAVKQHTNIVVIDYKGASRRIYETTADKFLDEGMAKENDIEPYEHQVGLSIESLEEKRKEITRSKKPLFKPMSAGS